jgi:hypothetical protein
VFAFNPLGIQSDGALVEGTNNRGTGAVSALEKKLRFNNTVKLKGGWTLGGSTLFESFAFDRALYQNQPTPGTVFFAGYSSLMSNPDVLGATRLRRASDGFYGKASYLFRL